MTDSKLRVCVDYTPVAYCGTGLGRYAERLGRHLLARDDVETRFFAATARIARPPMRAPCRNAGPGTFAAGASAPLAR